MLASCRFISVCAVAIAIVAIVIVEFYPVCAVAIVILEFYSSL